MASPETDGAQASLELAGLADVLWMMACGLDCNQNSERFAGALDFVERSLRRLADRVGLKDSA